MHPHHSLLKRAAIVLMGLSVAVLMTSCQTPSKAPAKAETRTISEAPVSQGPLPSFLDYLAAHRQEWDYDKIANICAIGQFDKKSPSEANWDNKGNSPFITGALFHSPDLWRAGQPLVPSGCYLQINRQKYPLSLEQYATMLGIRKPQLEKAAEQGGRFIDSHYKNLSIRAEYDKGYITAIIMSYEPRTL